MTINEDQYFHREAKQSREGGGILLFYQWDTATGASPASGYIRFGDAPHTYMAIHETDRDGVDISAFLDEFGLNHVMIRGQENPERFWFGTFDSLHADDGASRRYVITLIDSSGALDDNEYVTVSFSGGVAVASTDHAHIFQEDLSMECDGAKVNFITANQFQEDTLNVFHNSHLVRIGLLKDYTEDWPYDNFTMDTAPADGDVLTIEYIAELV